MKLLKPHLEPIFKISGSDLHLIHLLHLMYHIYDTKLSKQTVYSSPKKVKAE